MLRLILVFACGASLILFVAADSDIPHCPQNEVYSTCSNALCSAQRCEHRGLSIACPSVTVCDYSCVCEEGFLRNTKGDCVAEDKCDVGTTCPENQVLSNCSNAICRHQHCRERGKPIICPAVSSCKKGCVCDVGYLMNSNGNCIQEEHCDDADVPSCPDNEVYSNCSNALCRVQKCEERGLPLGCPSVSSCEESCVCAKGFLRNTIGVCVLEDKCDIGTLCPENQVYSTCSNALCRNQHCSERGKPIVCTDVSSCRPWCVCVEGFLKNINGSCVPEEQCDDAV